MRSLSMRVSNARRFEEGGEPPPRKLSKAEHFERLAQQASAQGLHGRQLADVEKAQREALPPVDARLAFDLDRFVDRRDVLYAVAARVGVRKLRARADGEKAQRARRQPRFLEQLAPGRLLQRLA